MALAADAHTVVAYTTGVNSLAMGAGQAVDAGDLLVVCVYTWFGTGTPGTWVVTGSLNGTYAEAVDAGITGDLQNQVAIFYKENSAAGSETVTVNPDGASGDVAFTFSEISGAADAGALDQVNENSAGTGHPSVASGALGQAAGILFAIACINAAGAITPDGTYTQIGESETATYNAQYKILASAATDTADWTSGITGNSWAACVATFKEGGPPPAPVIEYSYAEFKKPKLAYPDPVSA